MNKKILCASVIACGMLAAAAVFGYWIFFKPNFHHDAGNKRRVFVYPSTSFSQFAQSLADDDILGSPLSFSLAGRILGYSGKSVPTGCYAADPAWGNLRMLRKVYSHTQQPVRLVINSVRTPEELARKVSGQLMIDSSAFVSYINDPACMGELGYSRDELFSIFIANTYEVYWDIPVANLMRRMVRESGVFWNAERVARAESIGLTANEVVVLASIVEEESKHSPELRRIAGLYLNRLRKGMPLQSDPTVKYAVGNFELRQILLAHLQTDSPYNTYRNLGLPPSPIRLPQISTIDAVLAAERHNFLYMCADPSLNGTHRFAVSLDEHNRNAAQYHRALRKYLERQNK